MFTAKSKTPLKRITIKLNKTLWVSTDKEKSLLRNSLLQEQGFIDPVLQEPVVKPCLDHDHVEGYVRGVLGYKVNLFEGSVTKLWGRHLEADAKISMSQALRNLADYLEKDYTTNPLHGKYVDDQKAALRRMTVETIHRRALEDLGLVLVDGDKADLIRQYLEEFVKKTEENKGLWD